MKLQPPEILPERDVLGLEKPRNQWKRSKINSDAGFVILSLIVLMIMAVIVYFLD